MEITQALQKQRAFWNSGKTLDLGFRAAALKKLKQAVVGAKPQIDAALKADLNKSAAEGFLCEIALVLEEIQYMQKHLRKLAKPERVGASLFQFPAKAWVEKCPFGCVLIMSPWNYPFLLTLEPLVDAIAAGNTAVLKPSALAPRTSAVIQKLIESIFPPEYVHVVCGGREENKQLLEQPFDLIFFTGGKTVGKIVMESAAKHLTPVVLELGGKSPCIIDRTADIALAAKRIAFGKFLNAGQTCVAPDYLLIHPAVKAEFIRCFEKSVRQLYCENPLQNEDYVRIVNAKHFERLCGLLKGETVVFGGQRDEKTLKIAPTLLDHVQPDAPVMQEEIFGPILPMLECDSLDAAAQFILSRPRPLALYLFTNDQKAVETIKSLPFGGGCVNDTIMHLTSSRLPFGGIGESGMGHYHGRYGFDAFTHKKAMLYKPKAFDMQVRYPPYRDGGMLKWLQKRLLK